MDSLVALMKNSMSCAAIVLALIGCVPIPHAERLASEVSGTLVDVKRHPIAGARVEYLFRGGRVLGETVTKNDGSFKLGPFSQWFYLVYLGSPGVAPFPYTLERHPGLPDVVRVSANGATGIYLRGEEAEFNQCVPPDIRRRIQWPSPLRWTGKNYSLVLSQVMKDSELPYIKLSSLTPWTMSSNLNQTNGGNDSHVTPH